MRRPFDASILQGFIPGEIVESLSLSEFKCISGHNFFWGRGRSVLELGAPEPILTRPTYLLWFSYYSYYLHNLLEGELAI